MSAFGENMQLNITTNYLLLAPTFIVETRHKNGTASYNHGPENTFCTGTIEGFPDSMVAVSRHQGLTGLIKLSDSQVFSIHPLPDHLTQNFQTEGLHLVSRQRQDKIKQVYERDLENMGRARRRRRSDDSGSGGFKFLKAVWIADQHLVDKQGEEDLIKYLLIMANMVAGIYYDKSMGDIKVTYVINKIIVDKGAELLKYKLSDNHGEKLDVLEEWISKNNKELGNSEHFDVATVITAGGGGGRASIDSMCKRAGNVNGDKGLSATSHTVAHETGHNFGLGHDNSKECPNGTYVMSSATAAGTFAATWSTCSKRVLQEFLRSDRSSCLDIPPKARGRPYMPDRILPGQLITADRQCETIYGQGYVQCKRRKHDCSSFYCSHVSNLLSCKSPLAPAIDGTKCGERKWCIHGECVDDGSDKVHGGWSSWSGYTPCSKTRGGGVRWRKRTCTKPLPKNGGDFCEGSSRGHYQICNSKDCDVHLSDRLTQCLRYDSSHRDRFVRDSPCLLQCLSRDNTVFTRGFMSDGSRCSNDPRSKDVCIEGKCTKVGCDGVLNSGKDVDRCGVCNGDGTTCELITGTYATNWQGRGASKADTMVTLPEGATGIEFKKAKLTWNYLGLQDLQGRYLYRIPSYSTVFYYENNQINYTRRGRKDIDELHIDGPLSEPLKAMFIRIYDPNGGITYKYYRPSSRQDIPDRYFQWATGEWAKCSETCAGGYQTREVSCIRVDDRSKVRDESCKSRRPTPIQECNKQTCPDAEWFVSHWSPCSKSCGSGIQYREIFCRKTYYQETYRKVSNNNCKVSDRPQDYALVEQTCNKIACPAEWTPRRWSACSTTCGTGTRTRTLVCSRTNKLGEEDIVPELVCRNSRKPSIRETCNTEKPCQETPQPTTRPTRHVPTPAREAPKPAPQPTVKGPCIPTEAGDCCRIPFTYRGYRYTSCTAIGSRRPRCIKESGGWAYCKYTTVPLHDLGCFNLHDSGLTIDNKLEESEDEPISQDFKDKCAYRAAQKGYTFFAVLKGDMCLSNSQVRYIYFKGKAVRVSYCTKNGGSVIRVSSTENVPTFKHLGCFHDQYDENNRALGELIANFRTHMVNWKSPSQYTGIVEKCAYAAAAKGLRIFGVQNYGECWGSKGSKYDRYGETSGCYKGVGAAMKNSVYQFE